MGGKELLHMSVPLIHPTWKLNTSILLWSIHLKWLGLDWFFETNPRAILTSNSNLWIGILFQAFFAQWMRGTLACVNFPLSYRPHFNNDIKCLIMLVRLWGVDHTGRLGHCPSASPTVIVWKVVDQHLKFWTSSPTISQLKLDGKFGVIGAWVLVSQYYYNGTLGAEQQLLKKWGVCNLISATWNYNWGKRNSTS